MSRTTAYRYFPTQESLLLELTVDGSVTEVDEILTAPLDGTPPQTRLVEFVERFNRYTLANEALTRTAVRHYMDVWLAAERSGETHRQLREGRRYQWIASLLEPWPTTSLPAITSDSMQRCAWWSEAKPSPSFATYVNSTPTKQSPSPAGPPRPSSPRA